MIKYASNGTTYTIKNLLPPQHKRNNPYIVCVLFVQVADLVLLGCSLRKPYSLAKFLLSPNPNIQLGVLSQLQAIHRLEAAWSAQSLKFTYNK